MANYPMPYNAQKDVLDEQDPTLEPDRANANDNGSSTPPAPKAYQPPPEQMTQAPAPETAEPVAQQKPTFTQMQAAGEARPPAPSGASWYDAQGNAQNSATPPVGTPYYASQALKPDANGKLTSTTPATKDNAFAGYVSPDGGGFGGYGTAVDPRTGMTAKDFDAQVGKQIGGFNIDYSKIDPAELQKLSTQSLNRNGAMDDQGSALREKLQAGGTLTPSEQYFLQNQSGVGNNMYRSSGVSGDAWTYDKNAGMAAGYGANGQKMDPAADYYAKLVAAGAATPEQADRLRTQAARSAAPETAVATTGQTPPVNQSGGAAPTSSTTPQIYTPGSGQGATGATSTTPVDMLGQLMAGTQGKGAGSEVQGATQQAILDQLKNPNAYGSDAVKSAYDWMGGSIDDQYDLQRKDLEEEMARRGLTTSTIGAGRLSDLNIGQRSAKASMAQDLGQKMAESQQSATGQAINQGMAGGSGAQANQQSWLQQLMGYGQQGFENDMSTAKFNQTQNNDWQEYLMKMLGQGYGTSGA